MLVIIFFCLSLCNCLFDFQEQNKFFNLQRFLTSSGSDGLSTFQRQQLACAISEETNINQERVFTSDGYNCRDTIPEEPQVTSNTEEDESDEFYEYWVIQPDIFASEGSMDNTVKILESNDFEQAMQTTIKNESVFGNDLKVEEISIKVSTSDAVIPILDAPDYISNETEVSFIFKGANNTNGFIFGGLVKTNEAAPEKSQVQFQNDFNFTAYSKKFYQQEMENNITFTDLSPCTDFTYYWLMTNEDPNTYLFSTELKEEMIKTRCIAQTLAMTIQLCFILIILFV